MHCKILNLLITRFKCKTQRMCFVIIIERLFIRPTDNDYNQIILAKR